MWTRVDSLKSKTFWAACLAFLLSLPLPVAAQSESLQDEEAELAALEADIAEFSNEDFIGFLDFFSEDAEMVSELEPAIAELLETGPAVEGWERAGTDILEALRGGDVLIDADPEWPNISGLAASFSPDFSDYETYRLLGDQDASEGVRFVARIQPGAWVEFTSDYVRKGNALCSVGWDTGALHIRGGHRSLAGNEIIDLAIFVTIVREIRALTLCEVFEPAEGSGFTSRVFTMEGEPLVNLDAEPVFYGLAAVAEANALIRE